MLRPQELNIDPVLTHFCSLMDQYAQYISLAGKNVRRTPIEVTREIFRVADTALKGRMIARLEADLAVFKEMVDAGEALENTGRQYWRYLMKRKLVPCSDFFDKIFESDTIQVYGLDFRVTFVSLNFFDHVTFTLEQIFSETWQTAVTRDFQIEQQLSRDFGRITTGELVGTNPPSSAPHFIQEVNTEGLLKSHIDVKWLSPVYLNEKIDCVSAIVAIKNLE